MPDPESYGPEGGHMGISMAEFNRNVERYFREDCHRTEVDLEDTGALASRYRAALEEAYRCLRAAGYVPRQPGTSIWVTKNQAAADAIYQALFPTDEPPDAKEADHLTNANGAPK